MKKIHALRMSCGAALALLGFAAAAEPAHAQSLRAGTNRFRPPPFTIDRGGTVINAANQSQYNNFNNQNNGLGGLNNGLGGFNNGLGGYGGTGGYGGLGGYGGIGGGYGGLGGYGGGY